MAHMQYPFTIIFYMYTSAIKSIALFHLLPAYRLSDIFRLRKMIYIDFYLLRHVCVCVYERSSVDINEKKEDEMFANE